MSKFILSAALILGFLAGFSGAVQADCTGQLVQSFDCSSATVADSKYNEGVADGYCCVEVDNHDTTWSVYWYQQ